MTVRLLKKAYEWAFRLMALAMAALAVLWAAFPFPRHRLESWPASPVVLDVRGRTILQLVGPDDQWRVGVPPERISPHLARATIAVEDERFRHHVGVDPVAIVRAAGQNLAAGRIVSGASTIGMQVCRMMDDRPRTWWAKAVESFRALQLNRLYTKEQILATYLNIAPYGGNLRGVEAASLAYFGRRACDVSLAEAALLAGLPQSPTRYRPDRHVDAARRRQRVVLARMAELGMISQRARRQAEAEPIAIARRAGDAPAFHAARLALRRRPAGGRTTIDLDIQAEVRRLADEHLSDLPAGTELAVVVVDVDHSALRALVGSGDVDDPVDGQVNGAAARRSPGSLLKPFVYAAAFEAGRLCPDSIVHDVPIRRGSWAPENFDRTFAGPVTVAEALRRSLNIPAILVAEGVGLARCCGLLDAVGIDLPGSVQARGGLAIAVGSIEVTLLDLTNAYATLARDGVRADLRLFPDEPVRRSAALSANVAAAVSEILSSRRRRPRGMEDLLGEDVPYFAWKTGTSAGRREAWAIGHNRRYAVGVWVGRFRGTGRLAFVGARAAEPLLARLFDLPALRADRDGPAPAPILVRRPLPPPAEVEDRLRIVAPGNGETFIALDGTSLVRPTASRRGGICWFLNDRLLPADDPPHLALPPGRYELRCVDGRGRSAGVSFSVR